MSMKRAHYFFPLIFVLFLTLSCASTAAERYYVTKLSRKEQAYLRVTTIKSNANRTITGGRLGLLPLDCNKPKVGNVISDTIGHNLLDSPLVIVERTYLARILEEQKISLTGLTESIDYSRIGKMSNVDYLLLGTVTMVDHPYRRGFYTTCSGATARIVDVVTGEVIIGVVYDTTQVELKWQRPTQIGEALATALKFGLWKRNPNDPIP
jgi:curli biogenesis system outer membrane secretion channel CsgG